MKARRYFRRVPTHPVRTCIGYLEHRRQTDAEYVNRRTRIGTLPDIEQVSESRAYSVLALNLSLKAIIEVALVYTDAAVLCSLCRIVRYLVTMWLHHERTRVTGRVMTAARHTTTAGTSEVCLRGCGSKEPCAWVVILGINMKHEVESI